MNIKNIPNTAPAGIVVIILNFTVVITDSMVLMQHFFFHKFKTPHMKQTKFCYNDFSSHDT